MMNRLHGQNPVSSPAATRPPEEPAFPPRAGPGRADREVRRRQGNTLAGPGNLPPARVRSWSRLGKDFPPRPPRSVPSRGRPSRPAAAGHPLPAAGEAGAPRRSPGGPRAAAPTRPSWRSRRGSLGATAAARAWSPRRRGLRTRGRRGLRAAVSAPFPACARVKIQAVVWFSPAAYPPSRN